MCCITLIFIRSRGDNRTDENYAVYSPLIAYASRARDRARAAIEIILLKSKDSAKQGYYQQNSGMQTDTVTQ
jgi:hypothetical protein